MSQKGERIESRCSEEARLVGVLKFSGDFELDGQIEGSIEAERGRLIIGSTGVVRGDIQVDELDSSGRIDGAVTARGKTMLRARSSLEGDLETSSLHIEDDAFFLGDLRMPKSFGARAQTGVARPDRAPVVVARDQVDQASAARSRAFRAIALGGALAIGAFVIVFFGAEYLRAPNSAPQPRILEEIKTPEPAPAPEPEPPDEAELLEIARLRAIENEYDSAAQTDYLGRIIAMGEYESGLAHFQEALERAPSSDAIGLAYARLLWFVGKESEAARFFERHAKVESTDRARLIERAYLALSVGDHELAARLLLEADGMEPLDDRARSELALALGEGGKFDDAIAQVDSILDRAASNAPALNRLARIYLARAGEGDIERARLSAEGALKIFDDIAPYLATLAEARHRAGARAEAIELIDKALSIEPDSPFYLRRRFQYENDIKFEPTGVDQESR